MFYCGHVPLSDREKRLLAEMEEALVADDPRLVSALTAKPGVVTGSFLRGLILVIAGLAILLGGLIAKATLVGVGGFVVALTGLVIVIRAVGTSGAPKGAKISKARGGFSARIENRWDQRGQE
jgi:hypothetical protein